MGVRRELQRIEKNRRQIVANRERGKKTEKERKKGTSRENQQRTGQDFFSGLRLAGWLSGRLAFGANYQESPGASKRISGGFWDQTLKLGNHMIS